MKVESGFVVLNPKNEVEAVSLEEWEAKQYAENLSPKSNGIPQINRKIETCIILVGENPITDDDVEVVAQKVRNKLHDEMMERHRKISEAGLKAKQNERK